MNLPALLRTCGLVLAGALMLSLTGCVSSPNTGKSRERGWIGGEYKLATGELSRSYENYESRAILTWRSKPYGTGVIITAFPETLMKTHKSGILVTGPASNTPARAAGLREGDLILEIKLQPVTSLRDFRRMIDGAEPGTSLPLTVWRNGATVDCRVPVGRETYENSWSWGISVPSFWEGLAPLPPPSFSLGVLGSEPIPGQRLELGSAESAFRAKYNHAGQVFENYEPVEDRWKTWLVLFEVIKGKRILSQETVPPATALLQPAR